MRPPRRLDDGRLVADGHLTRSGVFLYKNADGSTRREFRPPEEVFRPDSLQTFALAPVTDDHPPEPITAKNARKYSIGSVGETVKQDGDHVLATLAINDEEVIAKVEAGKCQLSCGYSVDLDETPGVTPEGVHYDAVQRNIRGNHVAIVDVARAGDSARIRMDASFQVPHGDDLVEEKKQERDALINHAAELTVRAEAAEKQRDAEKARADQAESERDALKKQVEETPDAGKLLAQLAEANAKIETAEKARQDAEDPKRFADAVKSRVEIQTAASKVLADQFNSDALESLTNRQMQEAVIQKLQGESCEGKSDEIVSDRFAIAMKGFVAGDSAVASTREQNRGDNADPRDKYVEKNRNAGTAPLRN